MVLDMKKTAIILAAAALLCMLIGCAGKNGGHDGVSIVAAAFPHYDFARNILGSDDGITMLLSPGAEAHSYEPTAQDMIAIQNCDLFIYTGGESDAWINKILSSVDLDRTRVIAFMDCVPELSEEEAHEHEHEGGHEEYDEHVWTSPVNAMHIVEALSDAICEIDGADTDSIRANTNAYLDSLTELDTQLRELVKSADRHTLIFGDRFPFLYFVKEYGLEWTAAFPGCSGDTDADAAMIAGLIDKVRAEAAPVVFKCDLSAGKVAYTIAGETGAKVLTMYSCHVLSREDFKNGETYLSLMQRNISALEEALN